MKTIFFKCIIVLAAMFLTGCVHSKPTVVHVPKLNTVATAEVGQNMYEKIYAVTTNEDKVEFLDKKVAEKYISEGGKYSLKKNRGGRCVLFKDNIKTQIVDKDCNGVFDSFLYRGRFIKELEQPIKYKIVKIPSIHIVNETSYKYEVIYQGKIDNKLNIQFREYVAVDGHFMIRDAFTQNIEYELDDNGQAIIGFKGLRIKVLKVTNFEITYKVLQGYK